MPPQVADILDGNGGQSEAWVGQSYDNLFDHAPVPMHSIDRDGMLVRVNDRWLEELGYGRDEVLGRSSIGFLTEESRDRASRLSLPQFWRDGRIRGVGYRFLRKNGQPFDVLLDGELDQTNVGPPGGIAALKDSTDPALASLSWGLIRTLQRLRSLSGGLRGQTGASAEQRSAGARPAGDMPTSVLGADSFSEALAPFLVVGRDVVRNLGAAVDLLKEWKDLSAEQRDETSARLKEIERYLSQMV